MSQVAKHTAKSDSNVSDNNDTPHSHLHHRSTSAPAPSQRTYSQMSKLIGSSPNVRVLLDGVASRRDLKQYVDGEFLGAEESGWPAYKKERAINTSGAAFSATAATATGADSAVSPASSSASSYPVYDVHSMLRVRSEMAKKNPLPLSASMQSLLRTICVSVPDKSNNNNSSSSPATPPAYSSSVARNQRSMNSDASSNSPVAIAAATAAASASAFSSPHFRGSGSNVAPGAGAMPPAFSSFSSSGSAAAASENNNNINSGNVPLFGTRVISGPPPRKQYFKTNSFHQKVLALLNKVSDDEDKFTGIASELVHRIPWAEIAKTSEENTGEMRQVCAHFIEKACTEPKFVRHYARLANCIVGAPELNIGVKEDALSASLQQQQQQQQGNGTVPPGSDQRGGGKKNNNATNNPAAGSGSSSNSNSNNDALLTIGRTFKKQLLKHSQMVFSKFFEEEQALGTQLRLRLAEMLKMDEENQQQEQQQQQQQPQDAGESISAAAVAANERNIMDQEQLMTDDEIESRTANKKRLVGIVRFASELYLSGVLSPETVHAIVKALWSPMDWVLDSAMDNIQSDPFSCHISEVFCNALDEMLKVCGDLYASSELGMSVGVVEVMKRADFESICHPRPRARFLMMNVRDLMRPYAANLYPEMYYHDDSDSQQPQQHHMYYESGVNTNDLAQQQQQQQQLQQPPYYDINQHHSPPQGGGLDPSLVHASHLPQYAGFINNNINNTGNHHHHHHHHHLPQPPAYHLSSPAGAGTVPPHPLVYAQHEQQQMSHTSYSGEQQQQHPSSFPQQEEYQQQQPQSPLVPQPFSMARLRAVMQSVVERDNDISVALPVVAQQQDPIQFLSAWLTRVLKTSSLIPLRYSFAELLSRCVEYKIIRLRDADAVMSSTLEAICSEFVWDDVPHLWDIWAVVIACGGQRLVEIDDVEDEYDLNLDEDPRESLARYYAKQQREADAEMIRRSSNHLPPRQSSAEELLFDDTQKQQQQQQRNAGNNSTSAIVIPAAPSPIRYQDDGLTNNNNHNNSNSHHNMLGVQGHTVLLHQSWHNHMLTRLLEAVLRDTEGDDALRMDALSVARRFIESVVRCTDSRPESMWNAPVFVWRCRPAPVASAPVASTTSTGPSAAATAAGTAASPHSSGGGKGGKNKSTGVATASPAPNQHQTQQQQQQPQQQQKKVQEVSPRICAPRFRFLAVLAKFAPHNRIEQFLNDVVDNSALLRNMNFEAQLFSSLIAGVHPSISVLSRHPFAASPIMPMVVIGAVTAACVVICGNEKYRSLPQWLLASVDGVKRVQREALAMYEMAAGGSWIGAQVPFVSFGWRFVSFMREALVLSNDVIDAVRVSFKAWATSSQQQHQPQQLVEASGNEARSVSNFWSQLDVMLGPNVACVRELQAQAARDLRRKAVQ